MHMRALADGLQWLRLAPLCCCRRLCALRACRGWCSGFVQAGRFERKMHLKTLGSAEHTMKADWEIEFHNEFYEEFNAWSEVVQDAVLSSLGKLRIFGPSLGRPSVDTLKGSDYPNMKELRVDAESGVWRIAFAFDPKRRAILLTGGNKSGISKDMFYSTLIRIADRRYRHHLTSIDAKRGKK